MFRSNPIILFIVKLFLLNIIYLLFIILSVGILIGPATSSLFFLSKKLVDGELDIYSLWSDFWRQLKSKFKYSFIYSIIVLVLSYIVVINLENINILIETFPPILIIVLQYFVLAELVITSVALFYLQGNYRFESFKDLLLTSFYFANRHLFTSIIIVSTITVLIWVIFTLLNFTLVIVLFSAISVWIALLFKPISAKYELRHEEEVYDG